MTASLRQRQARLADALAASGALTEQWRPAFTCVPRDVFLPDLIWRHTPGGHVPVHRERDPDAWWELVYSDEPVVTQLDDGTPGGPGIATSSSSQPSVMARMLHALDLHGDEARVLEVGTGTGFNAALLAHRAGDRHVVTVEVDPRLAEQARAALARAGYAPQVVCADGMAGWAPGGPYDRLIATFSVTRVPPAWVEQTRPGGRIVVPLHRDVWAGGLATLDVDADGQAAHGRLAGEAWFMPARSQRLPGAAVDSATGRAATTALSAARIAAPGFGAFAHARLPHITMVRAAEGGGLRVWLTGRDGSAATAWGDDEAGGEFEVWRYGPTDLWRQVEIAWEEYTALGAPDAGEFGLTVTRDGAQWVWLGEPGRPVGRPAPGRHETPATTCEARLR